MKIVFNALPLKQALEGSKETQVVMIGIDKSKLPYPNCKEPERCIKLSNCPREYSCSH